MVGLHEEITLSFLLVGHTKFAPDWCFGLFKQVFRRTKVDCIEDIAKAVNVSAEVNTFQLVGTQEGDAIVAAYSWDKFFSAYFSKLVGIKKFQHFRFRHRVHLASDRCQRYVTPIDLATPEVSW